MTASGGGPRVVLVPGHWLGGWAWDRVVAGLRSRGVEGVPVTLPGMDPDDPRRRDATLTAQAEHLTRVVVQAVQETGTPVVLVAHSGANGPATVVLDRRPDLVASMVWVDSGPVADGAAFAPGLPDDVREVPLPAFPELGEKASLDGLTDEDLAAFRSRAVPQPAGVMREPVALHDDARRDVPTTLVCCSFTGEQVGQMAAAGHPMMAETGALRHAVTIDLPTGHWPMWSRPDDLAAILADIASRALSSERTGRTVRPGAITGATMPAALHPYLNFPGNTREAFEFYGKALGGTPQFATFAQFGAVPEGDPNGDKIMHASLEVTDLIRLYATDAVEGMSPEPYRKGNDISLSLMGDDEQTLRSAFENLSEGGEVRMPLQKQVWGDVYGQLVDRFGISWMVNISGGQA